MNSIIMSVFVFVLFFVCTPGQFFSAGPVLPNGYNSQLWVNLAHALVFTLVWHFTHTAVAEQLSHLSY